MVLRNWSSQRPAKVRVSASDRAALLQAVSLSTGMLARRSLGRFCTTFIDDGGNAGCCYHEDHSRLESRIITSRLRGVSPPMRTGRWLHHHLLLGTDGGWGPSAKLAARQRPRRKPEKAATAQHAGEQAVPLHPESTAEAILPARWRVRASGVIYL